MRESIINDAARVTAASGAGVDPRLSPLGTGTPCQPLPPGSWLGVLGGGQLGRMFTHAAQALGFRVAVLDPDASSPAGAVADWHVCAAYDDLAALEALADRCAAVTTEFENVPATALGRLAQRRFVAPSGDAVSVAQDRIREKRFVVQCGLPVAPHAVIESEADWDTVDPNLLPGILKVSRLGYDGKGQASIDSIDAGRATFARWGQVPCVLEQRLPIDYEVSVVCARAADGQVVTYPLAENEHRQGILALSAVPSPQLLPDVQRQACEAAQRIAQALGYVGVLCVEFFVLAQGRLVVNEMAPRPHNSGHYTMDACLVSQFEQQVRVLAGLPLGSTQRHSAVVMLNLLGDVWWDEHGQQREPDWAGVLACEGAKLHLYGKTEPRRGRKMGHINCVASSADAAWTLARRVGRCLGIAVA